MSDNVSDLPWHVVHGDEVVAMLQEAIDCGDAGHVYLEHYANSVAAPPKPRPTLRLVVNEPMTTKLDDGRVMRLVCPEVRDDLDRGPAGVWVSDPDDLPHVGITSGRAEFEPLYRLVPIEADS